MPATTLKITEFGAWAGISALKNTDKYIKLIRQVGLDRIDIMVNDGTKAGPFHLYLPEDKLVDVLKRFVQSGVKVSITTWAKPEASWTQGMAVIGRVATAAGVDQVTLDLEEPWITPLKNKDPMYIFTWNTALVGTLRVHYNGVIAVAPIVYSNKKVLDGILQSVDLIIPQCYSTVKNVPGSGHDGSLERTTMGIYRGYGAPIVMGAAAWNLDGAYGKKPADAVRASLSATLAQGITEVRYWRFEFLTGEILDAIREFLPNNQV